MKKAFITGISGQDGSYLAEYLISLGYSVCGIVRRNSVIENQQTRISSMRSNPNFDIMYGDVLDKSSIDRCLIKHKPDEIYNLAAQSHVRISFDIPNYTIQTNALGVLNVLESYQNICPDAKFYQASSSEMFGNSIDSDGFQRETTTMMPVSPYGCAKLMAYNLCRTFRESYGLRIWNGILFNHESPRRGSNFVTSKIVKGAIEIKKGFTDILEVGNVNSYRDWGHSKDYVRAMHLMLQQDVPYDFVVSSMETKSVKELILYVFQKIGLDYERHVRINSKFMRPNELNYLKGDSTLFREKTGWKPEYNFNKLIDEMLDFWELKYK